MIRLLSYVNLAFLSLVITGCQLFKPQVQTVELEPLEVKEHIDLPYQPTTTRYFDLLHMKLEISLDWQSKHVPGKATLELTPYFYSSDTIQLDAKGYDIHSIKLIDGSENKELQYDYDNEIITLRFPNAIHRGDTVSVEIDYTAKPDERESSGGKAITSDKGLFFINPDGSNSLKPKQVWTQGETTFNSCWFPTIDHPNERLTHDLYLTVNKKFTTLSNGIKMFSVDVDDSLRTDYWKMDQPHAPYLVMIAVSEFAVVKDSLGELPVNYYVDPPYEQYAFDIFGNTPEMIQFYSDILGVPYPWKKYSQVIVHDYVSGAMENTSAVVHGDFVQQSRRELLDESNEDVIAHELFHHWFGNLVTCESWSNIALNESFATYGEYLWEEYKYGQQAADFGAWFHLRNYLFESRQKKEQIVRHHYQVADDLFDGHSYSKGGRVLHMLRNYLGDKAFFESLKFYLETYSYQSVEMHDFRLACEKISGQDLNWFFDQWFYTPGHPKLEVVYIHDDIDSDKVMLQIEQVQNEKESGIFRLPLALDIYFQDTVIRKQVLIDEQLERIELNYPEKIEAVNFDAEKALLGTIEESRYNPHEWLTIFQRGHRYMDKRQAFIYIDELNKQDADSLVRWALKDDFWAIRQVGVQYESYVADSAWIKKTIKEIALNDEKSSVRNAAVEMYLSKANSRERNEMIRYAMADSSYDVVSTGLLAFTEMNQKEGMKLADSLKNEKNETLMATITSIYGDYGDWNDFDFFEKRALEISSYDAYLFAEYLTNFLIRLPYDERVYTGINLLKDMAENGEFWWTRNMARVSLRAVSTEYGKHKANNEDNEEVVQVIEEILKSLPG